MQTHAMRIPFLAVTAVAAVLAVTALNSAGAKDRSGMFCRAELAPKGAGATASRVLREDCYDTAAQAQAAAPASFDILFTIYADHNFGGAWYQWYTTQGCWAGSYGDDDFNVIGWNDRASSAVTGCSRHESLYEHTYQGGASLALYGYHSSLGIMDNQSSSWATTD